jgi:signal transduction histidine kinase/Na+/proline symporter
MVTLSSLVLLFGVYWLILFGSAAAAERISIVKRWALSPGGHVLAMGVYAGSWSYFGAFGMAENFGPDHLAYYLGASLAFLLAPLVLHPVYRVCKSQQLSSLADLFAFRFRSRIVGTLTTLIMMIACFALMVLQIQSVVDATYWLVPDIKKTQISLSYAILMAIFASLFGAKYLSNREQHAGLLLALSVETILKLVILLSLMLVALYGVFDGPEAMNQWLDMHPKMKETHQTNHHYSGWRMQIILFFSATLTMPHMFHMSFTECQNPKNIKTAGWAFPILLMLFAIAIPPIYWATKSLELTGAPEFSALILGAHLHNPIWPMMIFFGGLAASTGVLVVCAIALSDMLIKHGLLHITYRQPQKTLFGNLLLLRRGTIVAVFMGVWLCYELSGGALDYQELGLSAYLAAGQCIPGLLGLLFWPGANRQGFILGMLLGLTGWFLGVFLPCIQDNTQLAPFGFNLTQENWQHVALTTVTLNIIGLIVGSLLTKSSAYEQQAASVCFSQFDAASSKNALEVGSINDMISRLSQAIGAELAEREVNKALTDLHLSPPLKAHDFRKLRRQVEANLSGIVGPSLAHRITNEYFPWKIPHSPVSELVHIEEEFEHYKTQLTGLAKELDNARRFHRKILEDLPVGVCLLSATDQVLLWNVELERTLKINRALAEGRPLEGLPIFISQLLISLKLESKSQWLNVPLLIQDNATMDKKSLWLDIEKKSLPALSEVLTVFLIEDVTLRKQLGDSLQHKERLMSLGRLAAGVAHEIGNPITGIACMAQNLIYESTEEIKQTSQDILDQTQRVSNIVQSLVRFAHGGSAQDSASNMQVIELHHCIDNAIKLIELNHRARSLIIKNQVPENILIKGHSYQIEQVFLNLLSNACDASQPRQSIIVTLGNCTTKTLEILVQDEGCGISEHHMKRLFEPFFTTKDVGQGTGLGLPLAYSIMREHNGSIGFVSPCLHSSKGTCVALQFPNWVKPKAIRSAPAHSRSLVTGES